MQASAIFGGTVRITGKIHSDYGIDFYLNGTLLGYPPSIYDVNNGDGYDYTLNVSITVSAGDVIRIGNLSNNDFYSIPSPGLTIWGQ